MLRLIGRLAAFSMLLAHASAAMALVDAQVLVGRRWYDFKEDGAKAKGVASPEVQVAVHVDPIPLVPVAFGLSATAGSPRKEDLGVDQAAVAQVFAEVQAWIPMVPVITPYLRVRYPLQGTLATKSSVTDALTGLKADYANTYTISGPQVSLGAKVPALPLVKILIEAGRGSETYTSKEVKVAGVTVDSKEKGELPSNTILFGIEVGL